MSSDSSNGRAQRPAPSNGIARFTRGIGCPVCGGSDTDPRGESKRCYGFISADGKYIHCTRPEFADGCDFHDGAGTFSHAARGKCRCGKEHGPAEISKPRFTAGSTPKFDIEKTYDYVDSMGVLRFQVVRLRGKSFIQRRPIGKKWENNLHGCPSLPYRLPAVLEADPDQPIWLVEGERDVDRLMSLGRLASCNSGGAGKWPSVISEYFAGRHVVVVPDNDEPGRKHAEKVALALHGVAATIKVLELPDLPEKGDVSDFLDAGGTIDRLDELAYLCPFWGPPAPPTPPPDKQRASPPSKDVQFNRTELGNAQRMVAWFGDKIRYCRPWKTWYIWDGRRWKRDLSGEIYTVAKRTVRKIGAEASGIENDDERKRMLQWAMISESRRQLENMISLAETEPGIPVDPESWDQGEWLLNIENGTLDLNTGKLKPHDPADLITMLAPIVFDPKATCPRWLQFEDEIFAGDNELKTYMRRAIGSELSGSRMRQELIIAHGDGSNGKNVLFDTIRKMFGDYGHMAEPNVLLAMGDHERHPTGLADLRGKRFVTLSETDDGKRLAEALVKRITGDEIIKARRMHENWFEFPRTFNPFLCTNFKPEIKGVDHAIWRRIFLVPFAVRFVDDPDPISPPLILRADPKLTAILASEASGVLNLMIQACLDWQANGMRPPKAVTSATQEYRAEMDHLQEFIDERCVSYLDNPGLAKAAKTRYDELFGAYCEWAKSSGYEPKTKRTFGSDLGKRGFAPDKSNSTYWRLGIKLRSSQDTPPQDYQSSPY